MVATFKYLGRALTSLDDYCNVVVVKLRKAWKQWAGLSRILIPGGGEPLTYRNFYKTVFQETLLFGSETWVMKPRIGSNLGGPHHRVSLRLAGMQPRSTWWDSGNTHLCTW